VSEEVVKRIFIRFEVFTAVTMKNAIFWPAFFRIFILERRFIQDLHGATTQKTTFFRIFITKKSKMSGG
jgi:hypothetical protein